MLKTEEKIRNFIDGMIPLLGVIFVILASLLIRWVGKKYIGTDFHYSIYDIEENTFPLIYRTIAIYIGSKSDYVISLVKFIIYFGDYCTAGLALLFLKKYTELSKCELLFATSVLFLLNPIILMNAVAAMKPDSICMAFLLCGLLFVQKEKYLSGFIIASLSIFVSHLYAPIIIIAAIWICAKKKKYIPLAVCLVMILIAVFLEQINTNDWYYFGKVFVNYGLSGCLILYGYFIPVASILLAVKYKKLQLPAVVIHIVYIMISGWDMTSRFVH